MLDFESGAKAPEYLVDTSALSRFGKHPGVHEALVDPVSGGLIAWRDLGRMEMGLTARNGPDHAAVGMAPEGLPHAGISRRDYDRAWEVPGSLAAEGCHREVPLPDLLVAACAERPDLTVDHCDADFDVIAEVTGELARWVANRESL